jgi:BlaI family transcriptional regulator, penicillinase repressor
MRRSQTQNVRPTDFELELLRIIWPMNRATVRELHEILSQERDIGYTTILKTLQIMTEKGLVKREELGKAHVYRAARSEKETKRQFLGDLSQKLFSGSAAQLVMHALSIQHVKTEELEEIKKLILRKEGEQR